MNVRIKKLEERKKALVSQSDAILDKAVSEDRENTDEENKTLDANAAELKTIAAKIQREQDLAAFSTTATPINSDDWVGHSADSTIGNVKAAFEKDPNRGFSTPREFLMSVMQNSHLPAKQAVDDRLRFLATAGTDEHGAYADPFGGFLVPVGFSQDFLKLSPEDDPIGGRTTKIPMTAPRVEIPARCDKDHSTSVSGGLTVMRRAETQEAIATRMKIEKVALVATSLFGVTYATEEILQDSPVSFVALLEAGFRDQFTFHLINERLWGSGVGEFEGIINSPSLVTVDKDTGQAAKTITYNNIVNMRSRCWRYEDAVWLYNHDALPPLMTMVMPGAAVGVPIWQTSAREGEPSMLLGRPAIATEYCQTLGTKGDLILANWSQYLEGIYEPLQSAESIHVRFLAHERTFKFWLRNAGKCWWRSPLQPHKSAKTLSPFVVLNDRP